MKNSLIKNISLVTVLVMTTQFGVAYGQTTDAFKANPDSIRRQLLENNLSLELTFKSVQDAKDKVNLARTNLLPSINLGAMLNVSMGPKFILSSVSFLLPFLFPSNWFNLKQEKNLLEAEKISFRVLELNTYGSALSLYYTVMSDSGIAKVYLQEAADYKKIQSNLETQDAILHNVPPEQIKQARSQAEMADLQASKLAELNDQEIAAMRTALNLPLETQISFENSMMPASSFEGKDIALAVAEAERVAPELEQIQFLTKAATNAKWSTVFSFLGAGSLGSQGSASTGTSASFGNMNPSGSVSIGASIFPTVKLSNRNIEEVNFQDKVMRQQTTQVLESSINSIKEANKQYGLAVKAEKDLYDVYRAVYTQYQFGQNTLTAVLLARILMVQASVAKAQSATDLNLLRVTLNRAMMSDQFAKIKGCSVVDAGKKKPSLFEACREAGADADAPKDTPVVE